jgi:hypothetical protein
MRTNFLYLEDATQNFNQTVSEKKSLKRAQLGVDGRIILK